MEAVVVSQSWLLRTHNSLCINNDNALFWQFLLDKKFYVMSIAIAVV